MNYIEIFDFVLQFSKIVLKLKILFGIKFLI